MVKQYNSARRSLFSVYMSLRGSMSTIISESTEGKEGN